MIVAFQFFLSQRRGERYIDTFEANWGGKQKRKSKVTRYKDTYPHDCIPDSLCHWIVTSHVCVFLKKLFHGVEKRSGKLIGIGKAYCKNDSFNEEEDNQDSGILVQMEKVGIIS